MLWYSGCWKNIIEFLGVAGTFDGVPLLLEYLAVFWYSWFWPNILELFNVFFVYSLLLFLLILFGFYCFSELKGFTFPIILFLGVTFKFKFYSIFYFIEWLYRPVSSPDQESKSIFYDFNCCKLVINSARTVFTLDSPISSPYWNISLTLFNLSFRHCLRTSRQCITSWIFDIFWTL